MKVTTTALKERCVHLVEGLARTGKAVVITRRGQPVAQLVPVPAEARSPSRYFKHTIRSRREQLAQAERSWHTAAFEESDLPPM